jgi:hypothetical protein
MDMDWQKNVLVYITGTLTSSLGQALGEVCALKGATAREWLDQFEAKIVSQAKNIIAEGVSMENEVKGTDAAIGVFQVIVAEVRSKLS